MSKAFRDGAKAGAVLGYLTTNDSMTSSEKVEHIATGALVGGTTNDLADAIKDSTWCEIAYMATFFASIFVSLKNESWWPISIVILIGVGWIIKRVINEASERRADAERRARWKAEDAARKKKQEQERIEYENSPQFQIEERNSERINAQQWAKKKDGIEISRVLETKGMVDFYEIQIRLWEEEHGCDVSEWKTVLGDFE